jgi:Protein of unknown function (DUF3228)
MKALNLLFTTLTSQPRVRTLTTTSIMSTKPHVVIDPFCYRQFAENESSKSYSGTVFFDSMDDFTRIVNERYSQDELQDGYAPFCKHLFLQNDFTDAKVNVLPITAENEHLLRSRYEARNEKELPVLTRSFPRELLVVASTMEGGANNVDDFQLPTAKYLDLILYSREQIEKENSAMNKGGASDDDESTEKAPWGIVSIKAQDVPHELPMTPITAMRNALGKEEGGSGIPLNREHYMEAYYYWNTHAIIS